MEYIYNLDNKNIKFKANKLSSIQPTIKKILKKNNKNIYEHLIDLGFKLKLCNICKKEYNPFFNFEFDIKDNFVKIKNIIWGKSTGHYDKHYCYGKNKECKGLKMNPNSVEFISLTLNLTEKEALNYIHKNNKSPFYKENHITKDSYKKSQSRNKEYFINKYGEKDGIIKYNNFSKTSKYINSKKYYIDKFGNINGELLWDKNNKKKVVTLASLQLKYGKEDGEERYNNWRNTCSKTNEEIIERLGIKKGLDKINIRNNKRRQSLIENGKILIPKEKELEYLIYSKLVWDETSFQLLMFGKDKFGKKWKLNKKENNLHLDHMFSIKWGFLSNIEPNIIANIENLSLISKKENLSKKDNNSIEIEVLLENIKNSKYGK